MVIEKIYDEQIANSPITEFALGYDEVKHHSWYDNLDYIIQLASQKFTDDDLIMDYSCGTGIVGERINEKGLNPKILMLDASLKYLRLAYEKFYNNENYFFRLLNFKKGLESSLVENFSKKLNGIICTNAVHLYPNVEETFLNWYNLLEENGTLIINSGNILNKKMQSDESILIDETVNDIFRLSYQIVESNSKYYKYSPKVNDSYWNKKYVELKDKYFLPIKDIEYYTNKLTEIGFVIDEVKVIDIQANVDEWYDFLKVYDDGILGWIGGVEKVTGDIPTLEDIQNRLDIMKEALDIIFNGEKSFKASWNYIICKKA